MKGLRELLDRVMDDASESDTYENMDWILDGIHEDGSDISKLVLEKCNIILPKKGSADSHYAYANAALKELIRELESSNSEYASPSSYRYYYSIVKELDEAESQILIDGWTEEVRYGPWSYHEQDIVELDGELLSKVEKWLACDEERISLITVNLILQSEIMNRIDHWIRRLSNRVYFSTSIEEWCDAYDIASSDLDGIEVLKNRLVQQFFPSK
jgi:hypothetical protein